MAECRNVGVEQKVRFLGTPRDVIAEIAGIGEDGPHDGHCPGVTRPVGVPGPVVGGRAWHALVSQDGGDLLVARTCQVHGIDAVDDRGGPGVRGELMEPSSGGRLGWVRMGPAIGN